MEEDPIGLAIVGLLLVFLTILLLIPAIISWRSKNRKPWALLVINSVGVIWMLYLYRVIVGF